MQATSEIKFRNLFEYDLEAKLILNLSSDVFIDCNHASCRLFRITKQDLPSLSPIQLIPKYYLNEVRRMIYQIRKGSSSHFVDVILNRGSEKEKFPAEIIVSTLDCKDNVILSVKDVSSRKNVKEKMDHFDRSIQRLLDQHAYRMSTKNLITNFDEEGKAKEISDLLDQLVESEKRLIEFEKIQALSTLTAGISHELNNALNVIVGGKNLIKESVDCEEGGEYAKALECIDVGANRAVRIMNGLMSCSKKVVRNLQVESIDKIILEVVEKMSHDENFKSDMRSLNLNLRAGLEIYIHPQMLSTALENVIQNACFFTDRSKPIEIISYETSAPRVIRVEIFNPGKKINDAHLSAVFDPFFTTKDVGMGEGLGLSIAKACMVNHFGDIKAKNRENGVVFVLEIPL